MSRHSFDPKVAKTVGLNAAVIFQNITFWIEKNQANRRNFREGRYWTYNSVAAFAELFPYLSEKQIRTALEKLVEAGLIIKGNFNDDRYDRTCWYALGSAICPNGQIDLPHSGNDTFAPEGRAPAPEGNSYKNKYKPVQKPDDLAETVVDGEVERIFGAYPRDRMRGEASCLALICEALEAGTTATEILEAVRSYAAETAGFTRSRVCFSDNWFKAERWRPYVEALKEQQTSDAESEATVLERLASWVRAKSGMCRHITGKQVQALLAAGLVSREEMIAAGVDL